jgi:CubicO group peptidase (beta-lactamase class C family)
VTHAVARPDSVGMSARRLERVRPAMQAYVDRGVYVGVSTLIARRGRIVHSEQFGWRDKEAQAPMSADTIFRLYSMTKPIVCVGLMTLLEEARCTLLDPLAKFVPAFGGVKVLEADGTLVNPARPVMLRDLMTHMSGLTYHFVDESPLGKMYQGAKLLDAKCPLEAAIADLARFPLAFQPGSRWRYSVGIDVVARVIEVISGHPLGAFLRERLFEPLGMVDTAFGVPPEKRNRLAAMYGRPDVLAPGVTMSSQLEAWAKGVNDRLDVSQSYPVDSPDVFVRGGHGLFGTMGDYFRSPKCWQTADASTGCAFSGARPWRSCTPITSRRRSSHSMSAACPCPATASALARGWRSTSRRPAPRARSASSAGRGRRRPTTGSIRRRSWSGSS